MKKTLLAAFAALTCVVAASAEVRGTYIETRNAEIYASHCFANSEAGITGDLAVMAWAVESGAVDGVSIDGMSIVAVVKASQTIGDPFKNPLPTKTLLIFDEQATPAQRKALETLARRSAGELIGEVTATEGAPITLAFDGSIHQKEATLTAGDFVAVKTRAILDSDSLCHLDNIYYQPIAELDHAMPAHALHQGVHSAAFGVQMDEYRRSSVYLGTFAATDAQLSDD